MALNSIIGPRGYPGIQGLTGPAGPTGPSGADGQGVTVTNNGDGTYTITASNGSVIVRDGANGSVVAAQHGDYLSMVYAEVPTGDAAPTITAGTGTYDGTNETVPTGSVVWAKVPPYTVGYTTYMSLNRYVHDPLTDNWSLHTPNWSAPTVYSINVSPANRFTSYVFKRSASTPSTPTGGSYASPVPSGWEDGIPTGTDPVYISKRVFTEDGAAPQDNAWSDPALLGANGQGFKHQFGPTNIGPWDDVPEDGDEWMITCTQDATGVWVCDTANPVRIVGETGPEAQSKHLANAFKRSTTDLAALNGGNGEVPTGGNYDAPYPVDGAVSGWTANIPAGTATLYISTRLFTSDGAPPQDANWSGARLFSGESAANFVLTADTQVFAYDEENNITPNEVNLEVNKAHIGNDTVWTFDPSATIADNTGPKETLVITAAEFESAISTGGTGYLKVTATAGTYSDSITIAKVSDGSGALTGLLTNEVDSVFADANGDPTFNGDEGGEFLVYFGSQDAIADCTFNIEGTGGIQTKNGLRMNINTSTGVYTVTEFGNWTTDRETFNLRAVHGPTGNAITKQYTLTKSLEGAVGAGGTLTRIDFAYSTASNGNGSNTYPTLTFGPKVYTTADPSGKSYIGSNAITWTADEVAPDYGEPTVSTNWWEYEWSEYGGEDGQSSRLDIAYGDNSDGTGSTQFPFGGPPPTPATPVASNKYLGTNVVTWTGTEPSASADVNDYEWTKIQGEDGQSGTDALSISLSNPSHAVPCDAVGTVLSYDNSGTTISVREGATKLSHNDSFINNSSFNGQWKVTSASPSGGITVGSGVDSGDDKVYGVISGWGAGTGNTSSKITYSVEGRTAGGSYFSGLIAEQTFTKNLGGGGIGTSQVTTTNSGSIHGSSVTVTHPSQGGTITVNWSASVGSFPPLGGNASYGNDEPDPAPSLLLKRNGVTIATETINVETFSEDDGPAWTAILDLTTDSAASTSGNIEFKIEWSGDTSSNILTSNSGYISVIEDI